MPNHRVKPGETPEQARLRYNAEMREYRKARAQQGRPLPSGSYDFARDKSSRLKRDFGITLDEAQALLIQQGGRCLSSRAGAAQSVTASYSLGYRSQRTAPRRTLTIATARAAFAVSSAASATRDSACFLTIPRHCAKLPTIWPKATPCASA